MNWFYNMKIGARLTLAFSVVVALVVTLGVYSYYSMSQLNKNTAEISKNWLPSLEIAHSVNTMTSDYRIMEMEHIVATDDATMTNLEKEMESKNNEISVRLDKYLAEISSFEEDKQLYNTVKAEWAKYLKIHDQMIPLSRQLKTEEAMKLMNGDGKKAFDTASDTLLTLIKFNQKNANLVTEVSDKNYSTTRTILITVILFIIALTVFFSYAIINSIVKPIARLMNAADALALGDINVNVETSSKDELGSLMQSFVLLAANIRSLLSEMNSMSKQHDTGEIDAFVPEDKFTGAYGTMAKGLNDMVKGHISVKKKAMACIAEFAKGNFDAELEKFPGKKAFINENIELLRFNVKEFVNEMNNMSKQHDAGDIDVFVPEAKFQGTYAEMAKGVNGMVNGHINVKKKAMGTIAEFAKGNFDAELEKFPGKKAFINENIEALRKNLKDVYVEVNRLIDASAEGRLSERANAQSFHGDWNALVKGLNGLLDTIIKPINEAANVLQEMTKGNLTIEVVGDYKGDHAQIKNALNFTIKSFNEVLNDIHSASQQVASGARQVSDSSQILSQGSTEQASAIEQLTASMEEISSQTKVNAGNANEANNLALNAKDDATKGNAQMQGMLKAMEEINDASGNISKIIKVIDEIAFQTNILALNAAVEAARAGQHGKGFAVVAEEVRNLAARSANAAKETTVLIEGSIKKAEVGTKIANDTATALNMIVDGIAKAATLVGDIASASNEQATGVAQINQGIMQVSQVVQTNTATSEESAAASEELSSQAEMLQELVGKFKLNKGGSAVRNFDEIKPDVLRMLESMSEKKNGGRMHEARSEVAATKMKIALSDREFGKY